MTATVVRLTPLQRRALKVIEAHIGAHGVAPSQAELAGILGISVTAARWRLAKLKEKGAIEIPPRRRRAIRPVAGVRIIPEQR